MAETKNTLILAFFDGLGSTITPTANFVPPASYPLSNLRSSDLFLKTRTPDLTTDRQLTWDVGAVVEANIIAFPGSNATINYLRRFRASTVSDFSTVVAESGTTLSAGFPTPLGQFPAPYVPSWGRVLVYVHPSSFNARYFRWHQSDASNPQGFQQWGAARIGLGVQYQFQDWSTDPSVVGGPGAEKVLRGHTITLHNLTKEQSYSLENLSYSIGRSGRVLAIPEALTPSTYSNDALWCTLEEIVSRQAITKTSYGSKKYRVTLKLREVDR